MRKLVHQLAIGLYNIIKPLLAYVRAFISTRIQFLLLLCKVTFYIFTVVIITWLSILLLQAGDIHPNPGPLSTSSASSISDTSSTNISVLNFSNLSNHLSFVHYNVQSLVPKIDILGTELFEFDILAFSETWLNPSVLSQVLHIQTFRAPERKDRVGDSHG